MRLHENEELFREFINKTSNSSKIDLPPSVIEKDYWVTFALKRLSTERNVIFKGGTSLFKAYRFSNRFSEDIDIAFFGDYPNSFIKQVEKRVMDTPFVEIKDDSIFEARKFGKSRSVAYQYPNIMENRLENLKPHIVFESYAHGTTYPMVQKNITSLIYDMLLRNKLMEVISEYELEPFSLNVLSIKRTFFDKIFAINEYIIDGRDNKVFTRHVFDLYKIYELPLIQDMYKSGEAKRLYNDFLEVRIGMTYSSIKGDFTIDNSPLSRCIDDQFIKDFKVFQDEFVFPDKQVLIDDVILTIDKIVSYKYE